MAATLVDTVAMEKNENSPFVRAVQLSTGNLVMPSAKLHKFWIFVKFKHYKILNI